MKLPYLYPIKFHPQLKEKVWGGGQLALQYGKRAVGNIGESWEISGVSGSVSRVSNGIFEGRPLTELINLYGDELLGKSVVERFGTEFPLLFKFIDAREDLSVQLHPDDRVARQRHNSFGKTEMWYILHAEEDARLILGFNCEMDAKTYQSYLSENKITEILRTEKVRKGDAFFIAPGTVHAIGAGVVLAEIQQTSDVTYRIYDWDRPGIDGKMRELHNEEALDVIDYNLPNAKLNFRELKNRSVEVCTSDYFTTNSLKLTEPMERNISEIDSFVVYMCVDGEAIIDLKDHSEELKKGETLLIPACESALRIETKGATLLEVYVPPTL
ncbi:MAG: type I phosphomannose isomerase catalytic subunit [Bacteroidota bacterium]